MVEHNISPWMERIYAMLEDGPIKREDAVREASVLVPPGRADRAWRGQLAWTAKDRGYTSRTQEPSDRTIRSGSRMLVQQSLWVAVKRGRIEKYTDENGEQWLHKGRDRMEPDIEELRRRAKEWNASMTPKQRSDNVRRGWQTFDEARMLRAQSARDKMMETTTREARSERSRKGWETRKRNHSPEEIRAQQQHASHSRKQFGPRPRSEAAGGGTPPPAQPRQDGEAHGRPPVRPVAPVDEDQARDWDPHDDSNRGVGQGGR